MILFGIIISAERERRAPIECKRLTPNRNFNSSIQRNLMVAAADKRIQKPSSKPKLNRKLKMLKDLENIEQRKVEASMLRRL